MTWQPIVWFTAEDLALAKECAKIRLRDALRLMAKDRFGDDSIDAHYWGALGELAFARSMGMDWECTSGVWSIPDVGEYEVRSIPSTTKTIYLKAKDNDPDYRRIVLVLHLAHDAALVAGWVTAGYIREHGTRKDPGRRGAPAYFLDDFTGLRGDYT